MSEKTNRKRKDASLRARPRQKAGPRRRLIADIPRARAFALAATALTALSAGGFFLFSGGGIWQAASWAEQTLYTVTRDAGFRVRHVDVQGRTRSSLDAIRAIVNVKPGDPLFAVDPPTVQNLIARLPWVKTVRVERHLPDRIVLRLEERAPYALWDNGQDVSVIDRDGVVLTRRMEPDFASLPALIARDLPKEFTLLVDSLNGAPEVAGLFTSARWVGGRRWDLRTKNGLTAHLPEDDIGYAMTRLGALARDDKRLTDRLAAIDLRDGDRIVVRARDNPAAAPETLADKAKPALYTPASDVQN